MITRNSGQKPARSAMDPTQLPEEAGKSENGDHRIPIHGYKQIVEMLRIADPAFRQSLLRRIAARDRELAQALARDLAD